MHSQSQPQLSYYVTFVDGACQRFEPATSVKLDASRDVSRGVLGE